MAMTTALAVEDQSQVSSARRTAERLARDLGFSIERTGQAALAATELATNLLKHATRGEILLNECRNGEHRGIELLAIDSGPGFSLATAIRDGHSTTGSLGHGLGALRRLSSDFAAFSQPGRGSVVLSRLWSEPPGTRAAIAVSGLNVAKPGEERCGDGWAFRVEHHRAVILVADGLGHGVPAAEASAAAIRIFERDPVRAPAERLDEVHRALRSTRGAAVAIMSLEFERELATFAGLGNIAGAIVVDSGRRNMVSLNGTAGHVARKLQEFTYPMPAAATLVLHSDGLATSWNPADYAGLWNADPAVIAAVLYRDFSRKRDDVTVVVGRRTL